MKIVDDMSNYKGEGVIIKSTGSRYKVLDNNGLVVECVIKGKFRILDGLRVTNPVAVGDKVLYSYDEKQGMGIITDLLDRKNYILRIATNLSKEFQIIASNVDQVFLIISLKFPETPMEFIDRFLVTCEAYRIHINIIINKLDLYDKFDLERLDQITSIYNKIGYECFPVSLKDKKGVDVLRDRLQGKTTLLSGNSGVGKSSFINYFNPSLNLRTGEVSDYHKQGKHITTFPEMHPLPFGGYIIDSPGIRGFGVANMKKEEIYHFFPEIFKASSACKYNNCLHIDEPGCAVLKAVEEGDIDFSRYQSYFNILNDDNRKYR